MNKSPPRTWREDDRRSLYVSYSFAGQIKWVRMNVAYHHHHRFVVVIVCSAWKRWGRRKSVGESDSNFSNRRPRPGGLWDPSSKTREKYGKVILFSRSPPPPPPFHTALQNSSPIYYIDPEDPPPSYDDYLKTQAEETPATSTSHHAHETDADKNKF